MINICTLHVSHEVNFSLEWVVALHSRAHMQRCLLYLKNVHLRGSGCNLEVQKMKPTREKRCAFCRKSVKSTHTTHIAGAGRAGEREKSFSSLKGEAAVDLLFEAWGYSEWCCWVRGRIGASIACLFYLKTFSNNNKGLSASKHLLVLVYDGVWVEKQFSPNGSEFRF